MSVSAFRDDPCEFGSICLANPDLPRCGPAGFDDRGGLTPDELCPAGPETAVAAEGQFVRFAVAGPVAPFHRLHAQRVANASASDLHRPKKRRKVGVEAQVQAEALTFGVQVVEGAKFEESSHGGCLSRLILWTPGRMSSAAILLR